MREMRDSGVAWIGKIPKEWGIVKFKYLHNGLNTGEAIDKEYWESDAGLNAFYTAGLTPIRTGYSNFPTWKETGENDLLLARNGTPYVYLPVSKAYYTDHIIRAAMSSLVNRRFIRYCLQQSIASIAVDSVSIPTWSATLWNNQILTWPSVIEQERIAAFLDAECAEIDAVLEKTRASIEEYKKLKQAVITQAVTKGIRGDRPMKDSGIEWIGDIPAEWSVVPFSKFARVSANLVNPSDYQDYLQVSPENIEKDSGKLLPCKTVSEVGVESWNHFFHKGQILYSKIRPKLNKVCIAPFDGLCSADMYPIDTDNISKFVVYTILSNDFNQQVAMITENRVKMPKINQKELSKIIVVLPANRMEQQEIVDYLDGECGKIDALIAKKQQYLTEIENYKKSLIYEYVTGKKEVV